MMAYSPGEYGSSMGVRTTEYRRIGYTTNYASGNFSTSAYNRGVATTTTYYGGSYTPTSGSGAGRPGSPRKNPSVPDYDEEDGWGNWSSIFGILNKDAWRYYVTEGAGKFWSQVDWSNQANLNNSGLQELWIKDHPGQTTHPWDPYMTPIGEPVIPSVLLAVGYFAYKAKTRRLRVVKD